MNCGKYRKLFSSSLSDKQTEITSLDAMLDFNLYTDYCSVFGDDKDSGKILYSFVTWQEDRLLPQMNQFKDTLFDSIKECNETASNLTISEKRNVITICSINCCLFLLNTFC